MPNRLTRYTENERTEANLARLTQGSGLERDLEFFLLSCRSEGRAPATIKDYRQKLSDLITFLNRQGILQTGEVTTTQLRLYMLELEQRVSVVSVAGHTRVLRRWFKWLADEGMVPASPATSIKPPRPPAKVVQPYTVSQIEDLLTVCDADAAEKHGESWLGLRNKALILTFVDTGMRLGEVAHMRISHLGQAVDRIRVIETKNGEERVVALHPKTQKVLIKYLLLRQKRLDSLSGDRRHDFIWIGRRGDPLGKGGIYDALTSIGCRAEVRLPRFVHAFRHTAGTMALLNGATERDVQDMLGHRTQEMVRRYTATVRSEHAAERHITFSPVGRMRVK